MKSKRALESSSYDEDVSSPGFLFWKTFNLWSRRLRIVLEQCDLTQAQYSILAAVSYIGSTKDHVSQQDVADQLSMDKMMVSDVAKTLEKKRLLVRRPHPRDGRSMSLSLTSEGNRGLRSSIPLVEETDEKFFGRLGSVERKTLMSSLLALSSQNLDV